MRCSPFGRHGISPSSKYASVVTTFRPTSGIHTLYAPGVSGSRPRLIPTQEWDSMFVLRMLAVGLTAYTRHPKGMMSMTEGTMPVRISYEDLELLVGHRTRLSTSTAWMAA